MVLGLIVSLMSTVDVDAAATGDVLQVGRGQKRAATNSATRSGKTFRIDEVAHGSADAPVRSTVAIVRDLQYEIKREQERNRELETKLADITGKLFIVLARLERSVKDETQLKEIVKILRSENKRQTSLLAAGLSMADELQEAASVVVDLAGAQERVAGRFVDEVERPVTSKTLRIQELEQEVAQLRVTAQRAEPVRSTVGIVRDLQTDLTHEQIKNKDLETKLAQITGELSTVLERLKRSVKDTKQLEKTVKEFRAENELQVSLLAAGLPRPSVRSSMSPLSRDVEEQAQEDATHEPEEVAPAVVGAQQRDVNTQRQAVVARTPESKKDAKQATQVVVAPVVARPELRVAVQEQELDLFKKPIWKSELKKIFQEHITKHIVEAKIDSVDRYKQVRNSVCTEFKKALIERLFSNSVAGYHPETLKNPSWKQYYENDLDFLGSFTVADELKKNKDLVSRVLWDMRNVYSFIIYNATAFNIRKIIREAGGEAREERKNAMIHRKEYKIIDYFKNIENFKDREGFRLVRMLKTLSFSSSIGYEDNWFKHRQITIKMPDYVKEETDADQDQDEDVDIVGGHVQPQKTLTAGKPMTNVVPSIMRRKK